MSKVRLYARTMGYGSHAVVSRGFEAELEARGLLAGVFPLESLNFDDEVRFPGATAPIGLLTGPLGMLEQLRLNTKHERRIAMVAPNSSKVPGDLLQKLHEVTTEILVPSQWAKTVMAKLYDKPITVVPHGLDPAYVVHDDSARGRMAAFEQGERRVIHFSTSAFDRKGTLALMRVWRSLIDHRFIDATSARLMCVLDTGARQSLLSQWIDNSDEHEGFLPPGVMLVDRMEASPPKMARILESAHVVCQPSRGEAFGMIPMQALACGVPVVATVATGHSEHLIEGVPGVWTVACTGEAPIDDGPGAVAPMYDDSTLEHELLLALADSTEWQEKNQQALANAAAHRERWAWARTLGPWLGSLEER